MHDQPEAIAQGPTDEEIGEWLTNPTRGAGLISGYEDGLPVTDLANIRFEELSAVNKLLYLMILLCLNVRAIELAFEPWLFAAEAGLEETGDSREPGLRVLYKVDGIQHDLAPPPGCLRRSIILELEKLASLRSIRARLAAGLRRLANAVDGRSLWTRAGTFRIKDGEQHLDVNVAFCPSPLGDRTFLTLGEAPESMSRNAYEAMRRVWGARELDESAPPTPPASGTS
jgi:hypothetical protein